MCQRYARGVFRQITELPVVNTYEANTLNSNSFIEKVECSLWLWLWLCETLEYLLIRLFEKDFAFVCD